MRKKEKIKAINDKMYRFHIMYFLDYGQSFGGAVNTLLQQAILMKNREQKITIIISDYLSSKMEKKSGRS